MVGSPQRIPCIVRDAQNEHMGIQEEGSPKAALNVVGIAARKTADFAAACRA